MRVNKSTLAAEVLTGRQRIVLVAIAEWVESHGWPPTIRELVETLGLSSTSGVRKHLMNLESLGYIDRHPGTARGIRILKLED